MTKAGPSGVSAPDVQAVEKMVARFEEAWGSGRPPQIAEFLAALPAAQQSLRTGLLLELVKIDLECRWRRPAASHWKLEEYLARHPELGRLDQLAVDLIGEEYRVRQRWGDRPRQADYLTRFPRQAPGLPETLRRIDAELAGEFARSTAKEAADAVPLASLVEPTGPLVPVPALLEALRRLPLLTPAQQNELEKARPRLLDHRGLGKFLLERGWLTAYQVNRVLQGQGSELVLGPYVVLDRLGEGGTGQVFKARHARMNRTVALKLIRPALVTDPDVVKRFYREIQVIGRFDHPHIVHAYDAGPVGPTHFLAMAYVAGTDLSRLVKQNGPLPVARACDYVCQAAQGLQYAKEKGLVHRDIKPSNLLITEKHETQPAGLVKVLDLGLARLHRPERADSDAPASDSTNTLTPPTAVVMMGTADYMAPEQAVDFHGADTRSDIYSLGCTFYYLLTGEPPFSGTITQKLLKHQQAEPPDVRQARPDVPPAVAAVLRRMLAKRPQDRFQTPGEVAAALSLAAGSGGWRIKRRLLVAGAAAALLIGSLIGLATLGTGDQSNRATHPTGASAKTFAELRSHLDQPALAHAEKVRAILRFRMDHPGTAEALEAGNYYMRLTTPLDALDTKSVPSDQRPTYPNIEVVAVPYPLASALAIALSPDGQLLAVTDGQMIRVWDVAARQERAALEAGISQPKTLGFSPDGQFLAYGEDRNVVLWDTDSGKVLETLQGHDGVPNVVTFAPDGKSLAVGCTAGKKTTTIWDLTARPPRPAAAAGPPVVHSLSYSPDGRQLAATWYQVVDVVLLDVANGQEKGRVPHGFPGVNQLFAAIFTPDGQQLVINGAETQGPKLVTDVPVNPPHAPGRKLDGSGRVLAWSADGKMLLSGSQRGHIWRWERPVTQKKELVNLGIQSATAVFAFALDGRHVAVAQKSGPVYVLRMTGSR